MTGKKPVPIQAATTKGRCAHHEFTAAGTWWHCSNKVSGNSFYCEKCKKDLKS